MISVLYAPLFSAVFEDGQTKHVGLMKLLEEAHHVSELKANSCTGKLALLRLCIAFLSEAYEPQYIEDRADIFGACKFDTEILQAYVMRCEKEGQRFLLDDKDFPFMQAAYDPTVDAKAEKPVAKIFFDLPGGNNHVHCDHRYEDVHAVDTQDAFEAMLETYLFCPAGLSGSSNVNNTPPVYALIHGRNLFETLVLNMVSEDELGTIPYGIGESAWRRGEIIIPGTKIAEMSLIKALTWQPRRLTLHWDEDNKIRRINLQNGLNFQGNGLWQDPHAIYRLNRDGSTSSIKPELGRELWRDAGALIYGDKKTLGTIPLQNVENVWFDIPTVLDVELIGMITNQEAILGRVNERLRLPTALIVNEQMAQEFRSALDRTEEMYKALDSAVKWQFCNPSNKKKLSVIARQAGETFLHSIHDYLFGEYMDNLTNGTPFTIRQEKYMDEIWRVLYREVLKDIVDRTGSDVSTLKCQNAVRAKVRKDYLKLTGRERVSNG